MLLTFTFLVGEEPLFNSVYSYHSSSKFIMRQFALGITSAISCIFPLSLQFLRLDFDQSTPTFHSDVDKLVVDCL